MDDAPNFLVNAGFVAALVVVLTAIGQLLKGLPPLAAVPQWLPLINAGLGVVIAVGYTVARAQSGGTPATAVELVVAALSGVMAGQLSARVYDAAKTTEAVAQGRPRTRRATDPTAPRPPPAG